MSRDFFIFIFIRDKYLSHIFLLFTNKYLFLQQKLINICCVIHLYPCQIVSAYFFNIYRDMYLSRLSVKFIVYSWLCWNKMCL